MNCNELISHKKKLDNYHNDIVQKLIKIHFAYEQSMLIINNKIDNYQNQNQNQNSINNNKIFKDIKDIIKTQYDEFKANILVETIKHVKETKIMKHLPTIVKVPTSPPPKYEDTPVINFNNIEPSAPDFSQINNIQPSYNQIINSNQKVYVPPITYTTQPIYNKYTLTTPLNLLEKQTNNKNLLVNQPIYTRTIISPKNDSKKKKSNCTIS